MIDKLHLDDLIGLNGSLHFHDRRIYIDGIKSFFSKPIEAIIHIDLEYDESKNLFESSNLEVLDRTKTKQDLKDYELFESWAKKVRLNDFLNSPFDTVIFSTGGNNGCVFINSLDFDSTDSGLKGTYLVQTSEIAKASFMNHIKRRIDDKVLRAQYEKGSPFVIGIQASQWQFEYEYDYGDFIPVRNEIQDYLKKYSEVSAVILFTSDIYHGKLIENPNAVQKVTKDIFEKSGILYQHIEPQFTHDRKIELSGMDLSQKSKRIIELVTREKNLQIPENRRLMGYVKQDLEELLKNIIDLLGEKTIEHQILSVIEPVIKKYCKYKDVKEDDPNERNDPINKSGMFLADVTLRAYAAACLLRLAWHLPTSDNLTLTNLLSEDSNSYVRLFVCQQLQYFFHIDPENCIILAKKYCLDNKYVRWYLRFFLGFLVRKERSRALGLLTIIIDKYGKTNLEGEGEDVILDYAVSIIAYVSILFNDNEYLKPFEDLIDNVGYNMIVKEEIVITMAKATTSNQAVSEKTINYYLRLLRTDSPELKAKIEFHLLHELIRSNVSLLPHILPLLNELSNTKYDKPILGFDRTYHFTILDYIYKFFGDFPESATEYFLTVLKNNEFLLASVKVTTIIRILEKIFDSNMDLSPKRQAKLILGNIDHKLYWQARNLADKVKDL